MTTCKKQIHNGCAHFLQLISAGELKTETVFQKNFKTRHHINQIIHMFTQETLIMTRAAKLSKLDAIKDDHQNNILQKVEQSINK